MSTFDLLELNGKNLRKFPLIERKKRLRELIPENDSHLLFANRIDTQGKALFRIVCGRDLEVIVAKKMDSSYSKRGWLKIKNPKYSQSHGRKEMLEAFRK